jgi:Fe2+ or Zn2+ uptake regulation protein
MSVDSEVAKSMVDNLRADHGFETDISHVSIHGTCGKCLGKPKGATAEHHHDDEL